MKVKKHLAVLATVTFLGLTVGCQKHYDEGFAAGKTQGYSEGYAQGEDDAYDDAYAEAQIYFASADYQDGYSDGKSAGITIGYNNGYGVGKTDGTAIGYTNGYNVGYSNGKNDGYDIGYDDGHDDGYDAGYAYGADVGYELGFDDGYIAGENYGYDIGYDDGHDVGWDAGYDVGFDDGRDVGYDEGFDDAYGLSVGKTKTLKGYANVISMFHNDLIDYSKIKAPIKTKRGLVANGQLLLSETSLTNKDTLKRAAVVEQYLVVEMAKQVKGKFGLSAERSLKVAKAANHFRKYSSKRALTAEDTNAYASEILGSDFNALASAYENGMKGDLTALNNVIEKAAQKNETSPENMSEIVMNMFM